jgi:hypothetical protein
MSRRVVFIRTDVSKETIASVITMERISEVGTTVAVTSNWNTLRRNSNYTRNRNRIGYNRHGWRNGGGCGLLFVADISSRGCRGRYTPEDGILHSPCRENPKPCLALTSWPMKWRRNVSVVRYDLGFYITEDNILHSHSREALKPYIALTGWIL